MALRIQKGISLLLVMGLFLLAAPAFAAEDASQMQVDMGEDRVSVSGVLANMPEELVMLAVYKSVVTDGVNKDNTCFMGQTTTDSQGAYTFLFGLDETDRAGQYRFLIQSKTMEKPLVQEVLYARAADKERAFGLIAAAEDAVSLAAGWMADPDALTAMQVLGLRTEDLPLLSDKERVQVAQAVLDGKRENWEMIQTSFNTALAVLRVNGIKEGELKDVLSRYQEPLGLAMGEGSAFDKLAEYQDKVIRLLSQERPFLSGETESAVQKLQDAFLTSMAIVEVNVATAGTIAAVLETYHTVLDLDLSGAYAGLSSSQKTLVRAALLGKEFPSAAAVKKAFDEKLRDVNANQKPSDSSGGAGRSPGGGTVTGSIEVKEQPEQQREEQPANPVFQDLDGVPWAAESIQRLSERGIVDGVGGGNFAPEETLTREQYVKMILLAFSLLAGEDEAVPPAGFEDVVPDSWYAPYLSAAYQLHLITGYDDRTFGVGMPVTRQEMAVIAWRGAVCAGKTIQESQKSEAFLDEDEIEPYAKEAVDRMQRAGILNGVGDGRFAPFQNASRAEAAKMIDSLLQAVK